MKHSRLALCAALLKILSLPQICLAQAGEEAQVSSESLVTSPAVLSKTSEPVGSDQQNSSEVSPVSNEIRVVSAPVVEGGQSDSFPGSMRQRMPEIPEDGLEHNAKTSVSSHSQEELSGPQTPQGSDALLDHPAGPGFVGPERPVGHSLETPEAKRRVTALLAERLREGAVSDSTAFVPDNLPPLVDGQYGFEKPPELGNGVPTAILQLGTESGRTAIVVEKLHHRLSVFRTNEQGQLQLVKTFRAITGKDPGDKTARGDLRTPEGIYFVNGRLEDRELPAKYGRLALTLNYPNLFDQRSKKSGYGIWIHATDDPRRLQFPFDTEGCIAVSNEDIVEIETFIAPMVTPIIITKEMTIAEPEELDRAKGAVLQMLDAWRDSWEKSELDNYIEFYSEEFRFKGMNRQAWRNFKDRLSQDRESIAVWISDPVVLAFEDQMIVSFNQRYTSDGHSDYGRKTLHLKWESDRYRIISETWSPVQKTETALQEVQSRARPL